MSDTISCICLENSSFDRLASTVFQQFVAADDASENFAAMKRLHGLIPYFMLKGILRISNPVSMIRGMLYALSWGVILE